MHTVAVVVFGVLALGVLTLGVFGVICVMSLSRCETAREEFLED